jgi:DNA-binding transcriptional MerR regulator
MAHQEPIGRRTLTGNREIPDKLYFRIGEVAQLCGVPAYVLRFWETEFAQLRPNKGGTGQRLYRRRDVEMALRIKTLLYDEGYTIPGARQVFKSEQKQKEPVLALGIDEAPGKALGKASKADAEPVDRTRLRKLRREMQELLTLLSKPVAVPLPVDPSRPVEALRTGEPIRTGSPVQSIRDTRSPRPALETSDAAIERLFEEPMMFPD